ncbi:hypothetical protein AQJ30_04445 [Streptomyces longwoodensis]|uniref:ADP-ribosylglycohydrolase n=1 Tax=Streptomyces longwoodensis TaxID=68231 RepID=A0A101R3R3_9ACTN|nr:hypothetical protein AQJ30_04445 [Streptomyces longwoodensis]
MESQFAALEAGTLSNVCGLAGAYYGLNAIPARWMQPLHVPLPGFDGRVLHLADLLDLAQRLAEGPSARRVR